MSVIPSLRECGISIKYLECICFLFVCVGAEMLAEPFARLFEAIWRAGSRGRNPARLSLASRPACPDDGNPRDSVSHCIVGSDSSRGRREKQRAPSSCQINPTTSKRLTTTQRLSKVHHSAWLAGSLFSGGPSLAFQLEPHPCEDTSCDFAHLYWCVRACADAGVKAWKCIITPLRGFLGSLGELT